MFGRAPVLLCAMTMACTAAAQDTWRRAYGAHGEDQCHAVRAAAPDRFIAAGSTGSFGAGGSDIYLMAVDGLGMRLWSRTIGGIGVDQARDLRVAANGDLLIAGFTNTGGAGGYDGLLVRTDADGEVLWQRTYGGVDWDFFREVRELPDGGLLIVGQTFSFGEPGGNAWLLRTDALGDTLWTRTIGGSGAHDARSACPAPDGGCVLAGSFMRPEGDLDVLVAKFDAAGTLEWQRGHGGDSLDVGRHIVATADGGYSIMGSTESFSRFTEAYHLKLDSAGDRAWHRNWGQINDQEAFEHHELPDGTFISMGYTKTSGGGGKDMFLLKSAANGDFLFGRTFGGLDQEEGRGMDVLADGFICGGWTYSYGAGGADVFLVRTNLNGMTANETVGTSFDPLSIAEQPPGPAPLGLYPNPSPGTFRLAAAADVGTVLLLDASGRVVETHRLTPGPMELTTGLPSGAYVVVVRTRDGTTGRSPLLIVRP